jgi:hypothetical protein
MSELLIAPGIPLLLSDNGVIVPAELVEPAANIVIAPIKEKEFLND